MKYDNLKLALEKYRDLVIEESKNNLSREKKKNSGGLYDKIKGTSVRVSKNSLEFNIEMPFYGTFVDKGVSGTITKYNTPYKYTNKKPPALIDWVTKKRFQFQDKKGRFLSYKSTAFAVREIIYKYGIKPSLFFTKPFEKYFKNIPQEITDAFGLDVSNFMSFLIKQNFRNND
tara:strand:- start:1280 stop:1798 length:519 start_codon:yes stop_codon:yes gene_type:complete